MSSTELPQMGQEKLAEHLESQAGISRLLHLSAVDATDQALSDENAALKRDTDANHRLLFGGDDMPDEEEKQRILAARDVHVYPEKAHTKTEQIVKGNGKWIAASVLGAGGLVAAAMLLSEWIDSGESPDPPSFLDTIGVIEADK